MMTISAFISSLNVKGNLVYKYGSFYNFLVEEDIYKATYNGTTYYIPESKAINPKNGELLTLLLNDEEHPENRLWIDKHGTTYSETYSDVLLPVTENNGNPVPPIITKDTLIELDTELLNFDLEHPVDITIQPSYDGSVNLILNDGKNPPRLINSRFSVRLKNTYEVVDRLGENDTNIYNASLFDKKTSLYFLYDSNPILEFRNYTSGDFLVGLYCFYLTYCDSDDNESDFAAESNIIPMFVGLNGDIYSMDGGIKNQNSNKGLQFLITNLDLSYSYFKLYYIRYFADYGLNRVVEGKKLYLKFPIKSDMSIILLSGNELTEDIDPNILNISLFNPKSIYTQAQGRNILFFGNITLNTDDYKELLDCALRIYPTLVVDSMNFPEHGQNNSNTYLNGLNYDKVGYFNNEYYRFGVVFIYLNGTLSNVYNTLGLELNNQDSVGSPISTNLITNTRVRLYLTIDNDGWISRQDYNSNNYSNVNAKGVCYINDTNPTKNRIYGIKFNIPNELNNYLKDILGIRGLFFVRQKCVPKLLAQCYIMEMDELLEGPVIHSDGGRVVETFLNNSRLLTNIYLERLYQLGSSQETEAFAGICPDFLLNLPYYNQIFNGNEFILKKVTKDSQLTSPARYYHMNDNYDLISNSSSVTAKINTVTENVPSVAILDKVYKLKMGEATEAFRYKFVEEEKSDGNEYNATNLVRGMYSPYLAIYADSPLEVGALYNIYSNSGETTQLEYLFRMDSLEPFYSISDRYNLTNIEKVTCWRGDCFLNTFTYRLNRNFNDSTLPNNDLIIDANTWKDHYTDDLGDWTNISRSDVNAVQLGSWITIQVRSSINYALRSEDHSHVSEESEMGTPRSYYPRILQGWLGTYKMPDSYLYNDAYRATLGYKCYFTLNNPNYIKNVFTNRILYSAPAILDSFKNNYRYSLSTYYRDYSTEYGGIMKLIGFEGYLLVVFEHGIGLAPINERVLMSNENNPVYLNTNNVLPEELTIITDTYGSLWPESVIKTESGMVYGVDTIAKKIWRIKGQQIEILSDLKVNSFLVHNITLGERENNPIIGLKNVKTHYNNNKKDIMFTFYDDVYKDEEKVWNLCYNEILGLFITFYSWVPSYSENIDTQYFTFNRNDSKVLSLILKCNYNVLGNTGIVVDLYLDNNEISVFRFHYIEKVYDEITIGEGWKPYNERINELTNVTFKIEKDHWKNYERIKTSKLVFPDNENLTIQGEVSDTKVTIDNTVYIIDLLEGKKFILYESNSITENDTTSYTKGAYYTRGTYTSEGSTITLTYELYYLHEITDWKKTTDSDEDLSYILLEVTATQSIDGTTNTLGTETIVIYNPDKIPEMGIYIHGKSGIVDGLPSAKPTYWYDELHPFEFEFVVTDKIGQLKIFENLQIISNKAEPESFHFEVEGDNYDFSADKRAMYIRQEATKELYQNMGSDILFDRKYKEAINGADDTYRGGEKYNYNLGNAYPLYYDKLLLQVKSSIFPLYYKRIDTFNEIYHCYREMEGEGYDFKNLSGSEILWNLELNQFNVVTHIKNSPIDKYGTLRGNSLYKEGKWNVLIPSIIFNLKNEQDWPLVDELRLPPIVIKEIPEDLTTYNITEEYLPYNFKTNIYQDIRDYIDTTAWTYRKEAKIRDKWIKIRVRYNGKNIAIIHSILTLYNISYA